MFLNRSLLTRFLSRCQSTGSEKHKLRSRNTACWLAARVPTQAATGMGFRRAARKVGGVILRAVAPCMRKTSTVEVWFQAFCVSGTKVTICQQRLPSVHWSCLLPGSIESKDTNYMPWKEPVAHWCRRCSQQVTLRYNACRHLVSVLLLWYSCRQAPAALRIISNCSLYVL